MTHLAEHLRSKVRYQRSRIRSGLQERFESPWTEEVPKFALEEHRERYDEDGRPSDTRWLGSPRRRLNYGIRRSIERYRKLRRLLVELETVEAIARGAGATFRGARWYAPEPTPNVDVRTPSAVEDGKPSNVAHRPAAGRSSSDRELVIVEWEDSTQPVASWRFLEDAPALAVVRCVSVGWVVGRDPSVLMLAPNLGDLESNEQGSGFIRIPMSAVKRVVGLHENGGAS